LNSPVKPVDPADEDVLGESALRTAITMLLFLHLFALFVAVASNAAPVSALRLGLRRVPGMVPYLQMLHMDLGYNYHLTYNDSLDYDHFAEIREGGPQHPGGSGPLVVRSPDPELQPGIRRRRYLNLNQAMARRAQEEELAGLLPLAVSRTLLAENGITSGVYRFRCRPHFALSRDDLESKDADRHDPMSPRTYDTVYQADVFFAGDEVQLVKAATPRETAPVKRETRNSKPQ